MKILNLPALAVLTAALIVGCNARKQPADRTTDATSKSDEAPPVHKGAERNMKTIGVLGGLGPQATMDFEARIHRVAQRLFTPSYNRGYAPMVVYYYRHAPVLLTEQDKPQLPFRPDPRLLEAAKRLGVRHVGLSARDPAALADSAKAYLRTRDVVPLAAGSVVSRATPQAARGVRRPARH